jgi:hypothetical protein
MHAAWHRVSDTGNCWFELHGNCEAPPDAIQHRKAPQYPGKRLGLRVERKKKLCDRAHPGTGELNLSDDAIDT